MTDKLTKEQINSILATLDDALAQGPWGASTFLNLIGKKLQHIRDEFEQKQQEESFYGNSATLSASANLGVDRYAQMQKIFIALYASDGTNLNSWERVIANLPSQMISRPVYAKEEDIIAILRSKSNPVNEAYASIYVDPKYILEKLSEKITTDKLGKPLLALKDRAINLDNLDRFVHLSGTYKFVNGRLVKM